MKYSIVQLREFERAAFIAGDSEKAAIIGDLIAVFEALEILTEAGDDFIRDIKRATQYSAARFVTQPSPMKSRSSIPRALPAQLLM